MFALLESCFDFKNQFIDCADITGCGLDNDSIAWDFQVITSHALLFSSGIGQRIYVDRIILISGDNAIFSDINLDKKADQLALRDRTYLDN